MQTEVKQALSKEKALNAKLHEDLLHAISVLTAKLSISMKEFLAPVLSSISCPCSFRYSPQLFKPSSCAFFTDNGLCQSWLVML